MPGKIFINYRRGDDPGFAQALLGRLEQVFPSEQIFMDVDSIEPGLDFVRVLEEQVAQCDVLISVIGKNWTEARDTASGGRRLDNPEDFVRIEIESALAQEKRVIPVLVGQASMPHADELPDSLKPLARRNAVRLTHERFRADTESLIGALQRALKGAEEARAKQQVEREHQQQVERERQEQAERERQAQAERERQEQIERERQEQAERERQAQAGRERLAQIERERLAQVERDRAAQAERDRAAQAERDRVAQAERDRLAQVERDRLAQVEREAEAKRLADAQEAKRKAEEERQKQEADAESARIAALEAKARGEAEPKSNIEEQKGPPKLPRSRRPMLIAASVLGVVLIGAVGAWFVLSPMLMAGPLTPAQEQALKPTNTFQECSKCPVMTVVPAGSFFMGSPTTEPGRDNDESPQHPVTIGAQFAVGKYEVTFDEWNACVADGGCNGYKPSDQGWGGGQRPVINVSWSDATAYAAWLAKKTGKPYRLLSEAEYEYATRAGATTAYPWGDAIGKNNANCNGCGSQWDNKQTAPVGSFAANAYGLYDMVGNVWEWTQDCNHDSYTSAPTDGSAWTRGGDCGSRILRAGGFDNYPKVVRSADRTGLNSDIRSYDFGFRVARSLAVPAP
jgi:formylglycine-generating enzyme required for sulfatase activity